MHVFRGACKRCRPHDHHQILDVSSVLLSSVPPRLSATFPAAARVGGSLGCAEGEKVTRAFEYGLEHKLPVVVQCRSGGARMQEGTMSLMQMAKVNVTLTLHRNIAKPGLYSTTGCLSYRDVCLFTVDAVGLSRVHSI